MSRLDCGIRKNQTTDVMPFSADTDTVVASAHAYIHALNRLKVRREKSGPDTDKREIVYTDPS